MGRVLSDLEPKEVFRYFEDLSGIPRESGKEHQVADYLVRFAKKHGFEWHRDQVQNVLIRKKATPGYEDKPGIIIQGHTDMVCEKNADTIHNFDNDPIKLVIDGDRITADGTTLGADDGIGIALGLALLADKTTEHPVLELVCTSDEERGMAGAEAFDTSLLTGRIMINLDGTDEGIFIVGCAGGPGILTEIPLERQGVNANSIPLQISIRGLKGGHSGEDIHRGRANSIKLMARTLDTIGRETKMQLADLRGGLKYNAIPREADALIYVPENEAVNVNNLVQEMQSVFHNEFASTDSNISVSSRLYSEETQDGASATAPFPLTEASSSALMDYICLAETGIIRMSMEFPDTVESSVSVGVVKTSEDKASIETLTRSSLRSLYKEMQYKIDRLAKLVGGETVLISDCPEWEYNRNSTIKEIFRDTYTDMYGTKPQLQILHAGLECGVFAQKFPEGIDMIAAGPDARDLHTPGEYLVISSTARFWDFLREVIKRV